MVSQSIMNIVMEVHSLTNNFATTLLSCWTMYMLYFKCWLPHYHLYYICTCISGRGVVAAQIIPKGQFIAEYCGKLLTRDKAENRDSVFKFYFKWQGKDMWWVMLVWIYFIAIITNGLGMAKMVSHDDGLQSCWGNPWVLLVNGDSSSALDLNFVLLDLPAYSLSVFVYVHAVLLSHFDDKVRFLKLETCSM